MGPSLSSIVQPYAPWLVALGIGLLIGAERERRKGRGAQRAAAGLRTFTLTSLVGATSMEVGGALLLSIAAAGTWSLSALAYARSRSRDPGLTTEVALVLTVILGGLAIRDPMQAAALAVVAAILLAARNPLHRFVRDVLTRSELKSALVFAAATLVVWPILPDTFLGPFDAINLRTIWSVVILAMAISACGYVAVRVLGARHGLPLAGFASGFVSSSATIAAMGARAAENPGLLAPTVAAAVLSTVATVAQVALLVGATSPETLLALALPITFAGATAIAYAFLFAFALPDEIGGTPTQSGDAFSLKTAVALATLLALVTLAAAALRARYGENGLVVVAAIAGFVDAHATAASVASQVAAGRLSSQSACLPILVGFSTNAVVKIGLAASTGSRPFAHRVIPGLLLVLAALWVGFAMSAL